MKNLGCEQQKLALANHISGFRLWITDQAVEGPIEDDNFSSNFYGDLTPMGGDFTSKSLWENPMVSSSAWWF